MSSGWQENRTKRLALQLCLLSGGEGGLSVYSLHSVFCLEEKMDSVSSPSTVSSVRRKNRTQCPALSLWRGRRTQRPVLLDILCLLIGGETGLDAQLLYCAVCLVENLDSGFSHSSLPSV